MSMEAMMMALARRAGRIKGTPNYIPQEYEAEEPMQAPEQAEKAEQTVGQQIASMMLPKQGESFKPMGAPVEEVKSWQQPQARTPSASSARDASLLMGDFVPDVVKQQIVAGYQPKEAKTYTLGAGQKVFGANGQVIAQNEGEDELETRAGHLKAQGIDPKSPQGQSYLFNGQMKTGEAQSKEVVDMNAREAYVRSKGGDPNTPENQSFIKFQQPFKSENGIKFTDTDKKQIIEADDNHNQARGYDGVIGRALELNKKAYSGFGASARGAVGAFVGAEAGKATQELDSVLSTTALEMAQKMKGALSDNDLKFLQTISANSSQDPQVRENILNRLREVNQKAATYYKAQGAQLRGGTYYKEGGGGGNQQQGQPQQTQLPQQEGLAAGTMKNGYRFKGGNPNDKNNWEAAQ